MRRLVALVRAVNVGGITLRMSDLVAICEAEGFADVRTHLASGNVVFATDRPVAAVKAALEARLAAHLARPAAVFVRDGEAMRRVLEANPFADRAGNRTVAFFLDGPPPAGALEAASGRADELMALGEREIYVHYPGGMGRSKLRIPAAMGGTARNMNTVARLAAMSAGEA